MYKLPRKNRNPSSLNWQKINSLPVKISLLIIPIICSFYSQDDAIAASIPAIKVVVNSSEDGAITPDDKLTLREAISLVNGSLPITQLSDIEKAQIANITTASSRIEFNLPAQQTTIYLQELLPPITQPGVIIDGTTQPGYDPDTSPTAEINIPRPVVNITTATNKEVFRGLTILADRVTIRGLGLYGFTSYHRDTASTPPADIFIGDRFYLPHTTPVSPIFGTLPNDDQPGKTPENVVIENNWLGITPDETLPNITSAFGVSVFNAVNTTIRRNRISFHDGSAIITSRRAEKTQISENLIIGNGMAGIPDAIRLEGMINQSQIRDNLICGNDGSGIYAFKPEGNTTITNNQIKFNGRRFRRAAVYLMGNNHQIQDNQISDQAGAGVVVTSYPESYRNMIQNNRFSALEGLSIDLNTYHNVGVRDFQNGDGVNPWRNSPNRKLDTGNAAINSPRFFSNEFFFGISDTVGIDGQTEPNSQVEIYRITGEEGYGFLTEPLGTTTADEKGKFAINLNNLKPGDRISAIATLPEFGTSEPAYPALIRAINSTKESEKNQPSKLPTTNNIPQCITKTIVSIPPETPPEQPITLKIISNIHFALDQYNISPASGKILNQIAKVLTENPSIIVELHGHTDTRASEEYNIKLAERRANATRNYLIRQGIDPARMTIRSYGETQLLTQGRNKLDHARNRRVELIYKDFRGIEVTVQETDLQLE
ncbi:MAG: cell envelope biogenesis protein OmpA [Nostocales cyanobacterium]|nr:MAG: cell envelope biogenesis protein OmpA [Nostocales cyanobacterium]